MFAFWLCVCVCVLVAHVCDHFTQFKFFLLNSILFDVQLCVCVRAKEEEEEEKVSRESIYRAEIHVSHWLSFTRWRASGEHEQQKNSARAPE